MAGRSLTFFELVELHLAPPDLPVQPIRHAMSGSRLGITFAFKQCLGLGLYLAHPLADLHRISSKLLGYLVDCLDPVYRLKTHLCIEVWQVCIALLCFTHGLPVSLVSASLKHLS